MTPYPTFAALSAEWDAFAHTHSMWATLWATLFFNVVYLAFVGGLSSLFRRNRDSEIDQLKLDVIKLQADQKHR